MGKPKKTGLEIMKTKRVVIDASGLILGRLASHVAKKILAGGEVMIVNAEKAKIVGSKRYIVEEFKKHLTTRTLGSQKKAPKHPRKPDTYVRRVVRGMIPWKRKTKGKIAYGRLKVYIGYPATLGEESAQTILDAKSNIQPSMTVGELMEIFGWKYPL